MGWASRGFVLVGCPICLVKVGIAKYCISSSNKGFFIIPSGLELRLSISLCHPSIVRVGSVLKRGTLHCGPFPPTTTFVRIGCQFLMYFWILPLPSINSELECFTSNITIAIFFWFELFVKELIWINIQATKKEFYNCFIINFIWRCIQSSNYRKYKCRMRYYFKNRSMLR